MTIATTPMTVSVIIPVYNEERTVSEIIDRVCGADLGGLALEVIIADDASTDGTAAIIAAHPKVREGLVKVYRNPINLGKGAAVRLGFSVATGDVFLVQDADLEFHPKEYRALLEPIVSGRASIVYGSRFLTRPGSDRFPLLSRFANRFLTTLTNVLFWGNLTDMETAHKVFRREALDGIRLRCVSFDFEPELTAKLLKAGRPIVEVPIGYEARGVAEGKKLRWIDGVDAVYTLVKCRFTK